MKIFTYQCEFFFGEIPSFHLYFGDTIRRDVGTPGLLRLLLSLYT